MYIYKHHRVIHSINLHIQEENFLSVIRQRLFFNILWYSLPFERLFLSKETEAVYLKVVDCSMSMCIKAEELENKYKSKLILTKALTKEKQDITTNASSRIVYLQVQVLILTNQSGSLRRKKK